MSSARQVFNTAEMLEMILCSAHPRDILLSQRVSTFWKGVIAGSKKLQEAIFMQPIYDSNGQPFTVTVDEHGWIESEDEHSSESEVLSCKLLANPLVHPLLHKIKRLVPDESLMKQLPKAWSHRKASWRKMYLFHPSTDVRIRYKEYDTVGWDDDPDCGYIDDPPTHSWNSGCMDTGEVRLGKLIQRVIDDFPSEHDPLSPPDGIHSMNLIVDHPGEDDVILGVSRMPRLKNVLQLQILKQKLSQHEKAILTFRYM